MSGVLVKPTAIQPVVLPTSAMSRNLLSSVFVLIPRKYSHSLLDGTQSLGNPWNMR